MVKHLLDRQFALDFGLAEVHKLHGRLYDFVPRQSSRLLVTIGDSWTYGARLAEESDNNDQFRIDKCYGNLIAQTINADFVNLSVPAVNNLWMIDKYLQLLGLADSLPYSTIDVFITLTEQGREIGTDFDSDPELNLGYAKACTARELALALANYEAARILNNHHAKVKLGLGCNYVTNIYPSSLDKFFLPQSWLEVLLGYAIEEECFVAGSWVIPKFREMLSHNSDVDQTQLLEEITDMIDRGQRRLNLVYSTGFNYRSGYGHPNSQGHAQWANYILGKLFDFKE